MAKIHGNVIPEKIAREIQLDTLEYISNVLEKSFGPHGSTTAMVQFMDKNGNDVITEYTKDGDTIANRIQFVNPIERSVKDLATGITRYIVKTVGDGTTSVILIANIILHILVENAEQFAKYDQTALMSMFSELIDEIQKRIQAKSKTASAEDLRDIAMISTNANEEISNTLYQVFKKFGTDLYVDVGTSGMADHIIKQYDGMTIETGKAKPTMPSELHNPRIYYFQDDIDTAQMRQFIGKIITDNIYSAYTNEGMKFNKQPIPTVILCHRISRDTEKFFADVESLQAQIPDVPLIIVSDIHQEYMMDDIVQMCGIKKIMKFIDPKMEEIEEKAGRAPTIDTVVDFYGTAASVVSDDFKTKIIRPACMYNEDGSFSDIYNARLTWLEAHVKEAENNGSRIKEIEETKRRLNSFKGNMIDFLVGGLTSADVRNTKASVEDAVLNCRSAAVDGVGYGANYMAWRELYEMSVINNEFIDNPFRDILLQAYNVIMRTLYKPKDDDEFDKLLADMYEKGCPMNIRTGEYDGSVKSSIKSDIYILDAIRRILMLMYTSNQYMVPTAMQNIYRDDV